MAVERIKTEWCTGCEICVDACPMDVLRMGDDSKAAIRYPLDCITCFSCEFECPEGAIYVGPARAKAIPLPW